MSVPPRAGGSDSGWWFEDVVRSVVDYSIFVVDPCAKIASWNLGAERLHGYAPGEIVGQPLATLHPPSDAGAAARELETARTRGRFDEEGWRIRKDGTRYWASVVVTSLGDQRGFLLVIRDLSEKRRAEAELRESEERFRLLVSDVTDYAIFMLDRDGRVASWNAGAERIKGYAAQEIIGKHFSIFYPEEPAKAGWPEYELTCAARDGRFEDEGWRLRKDGSRFWANVVITALRDQNGVLRGFSKVTRDLTERRQAEEERRAAYAELEKRVEERTVDLAHVNEVLREADQNKDRFIATLAHELRNPLAPIRNAVELLSILGPEDPQVRHAVGIIGRQVRQMTGLVDDLLDLSRISRNTVQLRMARAELGGVIQSAVEMVRPLVEAKHQHLFIGPLREPVYLVADAVRLSQVLSNLLDNAAKFSGPGGHIALETEVTESEVAIVVRDDGVGIPPERLAGVFEMFAQLDPGPERLREGLGIGLTLARRLVEQHGGTLVAESAGRGCGSAFTVRLPRPSARAVDEAEGSTSGHELSSARRRVLVVDDNRDSADSLAMLLSLQGCDVCVGYSGEEALRLAEEMRPELVLLDIAMPRLDGYAVVRRLRARDWGRQAVCVAMTGFGAEHDKRRAVEAGFDHHLTKPIDTAVVGRILESAN